jgi:peptidoglycan/xylan/chitin deacetylase (PgdA/CDA1 family)
MKIAHWTLTVLTITGILLQGCASTPMPAHLTPTKTLISASSTPTPQKTLHTPVPSQTNRPQPAPSSTSTSEPVQNTPATLMLHRNNAKFDALQFLKDFIVLLKQNDVQVVTYRSLDKEKTSARSKQHRLFIITIDDIYLRYPIDTSVQAMIETLVSAGYPAVLGVVTESDYAYPETVETLRKLQDSGWEIASHSDTHRNLAEVEKVAPKSIYPEIKISLDKLETALGRRPITLILPEGQMTWGDQQIKRSGVLWVVGITGGRQYDTRSSYYYVGREGPDGTASNTFAILLKRFSP